MEELVALGWVELLAAIGALLGSLEALARPRALGDDGLLSWRVAALRDPILLRWRALDRLFTPPGVHGVLVARAASAVGVVFAPSSGGVSIACLLVVALSSLALMLRTPYGNDGADQMLLLALVAASLGRLSGALEAALLFVAGQCLLSYLTSGAAKLGGQAWRDGSGLVGVLSTRTYGWEWLAGVLRSRPVLARVLSWTVILTELLFVLVLVVPTSWVPLFLAGGALFHLASAAVMGLNAFVWAFGATYPAILYVAEQI